ncbi:MAG: plastocyanin/azurin family copper-binding protein [Candidatus Dormibacteria bacterium]
MRRVLMLGALALFVAGCSTESALPVTDIRPFKADPTVSLAQGTITGHDVPIKISASNFKPVDAASAENKHVYGEGHFHLFLDVPPTAPGEVVPRTAGIFHTTKTNFVLPDVADGKHHLYVVLGFSDHTPYQAFIDQGGKFHGAIAELDFAVGADQTAATQEAPDATASAAPAPTASAARSGGGGTKVDVIGDASAGGAYKPQPVTVKVGDTVTWNWVDDSASHTVTSDDGKFDSGLLQKGGTFSQKFTTAGTVKYHCAVHPQMVGTVVVQ